MTDKKNQDRLTETDFKFLERCLELAEEDLRAGDEPFGSILVNEKGEILAEDRNRVNEINVLYHPEIELAKWSVENLSSEERKNTTLYTSGEHCPMCAAAHGWAGIGGLVYLSSATQLSEWLSETNAPTPPIHFHPVEKIVRNLRLKKGSAEGELLCRIKELHLKFHQKSN